MIFFNKIKKIFPILYILFLLFSFFYIKQVLQDENLSVVKKDDNNNIEDEEDIEVKPADVVLIIEKDGTTPFQYKKRMKNTNTFDDFLEELVEDDNFYYEKTYYIHGVEYSMFNRINISPDYIWKIYRNDSDVTNSTPQLMLADNDIYRIVLTKR